MAKFAALTVGMTFALGAVATPAGAQSIAELQAQINALMAQLAALSGSTGTTGGAYSFSQDLTVGATGAAVTSLQQFLVGQGHLTMPAGVAYGYFGSLTQAAVAKWQAANGVAPAVGYWGPISRAKANMTAGGATGTVPGSTVGGGTTTTGGTINTPGVEGILTATVAPTPSSGQTLREGENKEGVIGVEIEADLSDIKIERIKVKLDDTTNGNDRDFYRDITGMMYVMDGSTVIASVDLDSGTVIEESSGNFYVTITGLNYIVRKDTKKTLTVAIDVEDSVDSTLTNGDVWTVTIPAEGIRGVDGAGVNQYAPAAAIARTFTVDDAAAEDATVEVSLNSNSPDATSVVASQGSDEDELDGLELLRFDVRSEDDDVVITDVVVDITRGGTTSTATATTAYLYDGSNLVGSATVAGTSLTAMTATFDDIEVDVNEDSTKVLTVKVDIVDAGTAATTFSAAVTADADFVAENSLGDDIEETGSATGETITVSSIGVELSLVSKSISKTLSPEQGGVSTSSAEATFVIRVKAIGGDILFGDAASTTYPIVSNAIADVDDSFDVYVGGALSNQAVASTTSINVPSGVTTSGLTGGDSFLLQENNSTDITVSFLLQGRTPAGALVTPGSYSIGLERVNWVSSAGEQSSTWMDAETSWRTSSVSLP